jgi:hypothetical protein
MNSRMMHNTRLLLWLLAALGWGATALAQEPVVDPDKPVVTLKYRDITNRQEFKFKVADKGEFSKPVGEMNFEFPEGTSPSNGMDATQRTFCVEPLVPIYAGRLYDFQLQSTTEPKYYSLPETPEGKLEAQKRLTYIRELYGRNYADTVNDPKVSSPAFQVALWKIVGETNVPEGPMPFNLFAGNFQASYPNEAESPEFVQLAQKYLQALTGDDAPFRDSTLLSGMQLVRLNGLPGADGFVPQAQLALRTGGNTPGSSGTSSGGGGGAAGGGGVLPLASLSGPNSGSPTGLGGTSFGPRVGSPLLGGGGSNFPQAGGFGGAGGGNTAVQTGDSTSSAQTPDTGTVTQPPPVRDPQSTFEPPGNNTNPPGGTTNTNPPSNPIDNPDVPDPNNPVPAPPALVLGLVGVAMFWGRRRWRRSCES